MRIVLGLLVIMAATLFSTNGTMPGASAQTPEGTGGSIQVIEVTAKKYEFNPSPIRVKQGARVQLKITALDHSHGFTIKEVAEGEGKGASPGLVFSSAEHCQKIEKGETQTIEFVAQKPGTYAFKCCVDCGLHHRSMKGELIVEP